MNKNTILAIVFLLTAAGIGLFLLKDRGQTESVLQTTADNIQVQGANQSKSTQVKTPFIPPADTIEVIHFHATQQCWSCITVGEYALKTIEEKFPNEYVNGKIIYKDINVESSENKEIAGRYQATGASLYINAIKNGNDFIEQDATVWRLVNSESQYTTYFEGKLKTLLGK